MFGTDGVRGLANTFISPELCFKLGKAAGLYIREAGLKRRVVIGRDTRRSGPMLGAALSAGFCHVGIDVVALGVVPTGGISYIGRVGDYSMAAVISASHNPAEDNGVKFLGHDGRKISPAQEDILTSLIEASEYERVVGTEVGYLENSRAELDGYIDYLVSLVPERLDGMHVAIDAAHGAAYHLGVDLFGRLGARVIKTGVEPDGNNINLGHGATHPETIQALTKSSGANLGIAYDGDADRAVFSDVEGRLINGDRTMAIWCRHWHEELTPKVAVGTVMSNGGFEQSLKQDGVALHRVAVGDKYVSAELVKTSGKVGGEQSGHIIFSERGPTGDGLITALELARVVKREGKTLAELYGVYEPWPQVLINLQVRDRDAFKSSAAISASIEKATETLGDRGRINVRPSGTQPMVRVMVEADEYGLRDEVAKAVVQSFSDHAGVLDSRTIDLTHALGD